jgi:type IV pilus assembly protein PilB
MADDVQLMSTRNISRNSAELEQTLRERAHDHLKLGQLLLREHVISSDTLRTALEMQHKSPTKKLGEILSEMGALSASQAEDAITAVLEFATVRLAEFDFDRHAIALVPAEQARKHHFIPLMFHNNMLVLAIHALPDSETRELLSFTVERPILFALSTRDEVDRAIAHNYYVLNETQVLASLEQTTPEPTDQQLMWQEADHLAQQQPLVKLVNSILTEAIHQRASDIHVRPGEKGFEVLYRIDGTLIAIRELPKSLLPAVVSRMKILSRLKPLNGLMQARTKKISIAEVYRACM